MAREDDIFLSPGAGFRPVSLTQALGVRTGVPPAVASPAAAAPSPPPSRGVPPVADRSIPSQGQALLMTIGQGESNNNYAARFRQKDLTDFSQHPNTYARITSGPNKGLSSNSAGRYQFISTTWQDQANKLGLKDFSPASQDKAAWNLANETYQRFNKGRDLATDLQDPSRYPQILRALKTQWSSLPGGVEQNQSANTFASRFQSNLNAATAVARQPEAPAKPMQDVGTPAYRPAVGAGVQGPVDYLGLFS